LKGTKKSKTKKAQVTGRVRKSCASASLAVILFLGSYSSRRRTKSKKRAVEISAEYGIS